MDAARSQSSCMLFMRKLEGPPTLAQLEGPPTLAQNEWTLAKLSDGTPNPRHASPVLPPGWGLPLVA